MQEVMGELSVEFEGVNPEDLDQQEVVSFIVNALEERGVPDDVLSFI